MNLFPNGDGQHSGFVLSVQQARFPTLRKLLGYINEKYTLVSGQCRRIYTIDGLVVSTIDDLDHGQGYVLVSGDDQFYRIPYNVNSLTQSTGPRGMDGYTKNNDMMGHLKPIKPMWKVQEERRAAKTKEWDGSQEIIRKKPLVKPQKKQAIQEIQEDYEDVDDDESAVFESQELAQFNEPVEAEESSDQYDDGSAEDFELGPGTSLISHPHSEEEEVADVEVADDTDDQGGFVASAGSLDDEPAAADDSESSDAEDDVSDIEEAVSAVEQHAAAAVEDVESAEASDEESAVEDESAVEAEEDVEEGAEVPKASDTKFSSIQSLPLSSKPVSQSNLLSQKSLGKVLSQTSLSGGKSRIPVRSNSELNN